MKTWKKILAILLSAVIIAACPVSVCAETGGSTLPFPDVKPSDWFYNSVAFAYESGLINGYGDGTFRPNTETTRGMVVAILYNLEGKPETDGMDFPDVPNGKWYEKPIKWASAVGIVSGYGDGRFKPDAPITREQMAVILRNYASYKGYDVSGSIDFSHFPDSATVSAYASESMSWAVAVEIITGVGGTHLKPKSQATRAQVAAILMRFCQKFNNDPGSDYSRFENAKNSALSALLSRLSEGQESIYVYKDYCLTENHFTQKAKMAGSYQALVKDMDENCQDNPYSGSSCIRCEQITRVGDWGGWLFLNGWLAPGEIVPRLNDGTVDGQGLDLTGARSLTFWARGRNGGEAVEFFTCGFGYDGQSGRQIVLYPDSTKKHSLGTIKLEKEWRHYSIDLTGTDMSDIACGFGYVLSGDKSGSGTSVFYLDNIRFEGDFSGREDHPMLRSYDTENIYIKNAAFSYDNALTAMAFLSDGRKAEAAKLLDSFVYAVENDRFQPGRVRNAYAAGDITPFPGWDGAARLPGWYDANSKMWYEDRYQTGSNVGNTSYVALALLQYDAMYGCERYLNTAKALMDWVIDSCSDGRLGFTAGYDGWPEGGAETTYTFTYKSIEHNIDAYAAFQQLYAKTGDSRYAAAADSALEFIRSMYDDEKHIFYTGTLNDGATPSTDNLVLDAQVWTCMALAKDFAPYEASLKIVDAMRTAEGGYPFCAANANGGWWAEGTAYTALMYRLRGENDKAAAALEALESIQLDDGLLPAATVDNLSTGFYLFNGTPWEYGTAPHIAPTAWYVMAVNGFNPYSFEH